MSSISCFIGINIGRHDSSVARVEIAPQLKIELFEEERLSRVKNRGGYPYSAIRRLNQESPVAAVPSKNCAFVNFGVPLSEAMRRVRLFPMHRDLLEQLGAQKLSPANSRAARLSHHECHLFSILPLVRSARALIVVADGCGSPMDDVRRYHLLPHPPLKRLSGHENISVYLKDKNQLRCLKKFTLPDINDVSSIIHCPSFVYERTSTLIFGANKFCGKVMGLATLPPHQAISEADLKRQLLGPMHDRTVSKAQFDELPADTLQSYVDLSHASQRFFQETFLKLFRELKEEHPGVETLAFAGGCALNCPLNTETARQGIFRELILSPFPNDEGLAVGAALANAYRQGHYRPQRHFFGPEVPFLGPRQDFSFQRIQETFGDVATITRIKDYDALAGLLKRGEVIAWIQGRSETGPRALGHRSLLASPFKAGIKQRLNDEFKFREAFRPYGVSLLHTDTSEYFEWPKARVSPYMSYTPRVKAAHRKRLKEVLQPDHSLRIHTVDRSQQAFYRLLRSFKQASGHGVLIHTSLNVMDEPILESLHDALRFFRSSPIRYMVIEGYLIRKARGKKSTP